MRSLLLPLLLIPLLLLPTPQQVAAQQPDDWGSPSSISRSPENYAFAPSVTFDAFGAIHVAWEQWRGVEEGSAQVFYSVNRGDGWSEPTVISGDVVPARVPALAADGAGIVHLTFAGGTRGASNQIYYAALEPDGTWHGPALVQDTNRINGAARPTIVTDAANEAHLLWMHDKPGGYDIASRTHYPDGGWSEMSFVIRNPGYTDRPRGVALGGPGEQTLHVVSKLRTDNGDEIIAYVRGYGDNWTEPVRISAKTRRVYTPAIATDGWRLFAAWDHTHDGDHDIHFSMSSDGGNSWTNPIRADRPKGIATAPSLTTVAGQLLLVWQLQDRLLARSMNIESGEWGPVEDVNAEYRQDDVRDPEVVSGPGDRAVVVWQQRRDDNNNFEVLLAEWQPW